VTIGILKLTLFIHQSNSLKERRMALHSVKAKLRNHFNVAVTQIDDEDKWQKATLAVVSVGRDRKIVNSLLSEVVNFVNRFHNLYIIDYEMELI
jgi:uncharacterized protein YlxP (DUF503 family)